MALNKALQNFVDNGKDTDSFWIEDAKLEFALALEQHRKKAGMTYKEIASKIATSAAYITKVFRGDSNLTIDSMVKLARSVGGRVEIKIVDEHAKEAAPAITGWNQGTKFVLLHLPPRACNTVTSNAVSVSDAKCQTALELEAAA